MSDLPSTDDTLDPEFAQDEGNEFHFRCTTRLLKIMDHYKDVVRNYTKVTSRTQLAEIILNSDVVSDMKSRTIGIGHCINLVDRFCICFRHIPFGFNDDTTIDVEDEQKDRQMLVNIRKRKYGMLRNIAEQLNVTNSKAARICVFVGLKNLDDIIESVDEDYEQHVKGTLLRDVNDAHATTVYTISRFWQNFGAWMRTMFTDGYDETERIFEERLGDTDHFARVYRDEFMSTNAYDEVLDKIGKEPFENLEGLIDEYTEVSLEQ